MTYQQAIGTNHMNSLSDPLIVSFLSITSLFNFSRTNSCSWVGIIYFDVYSISFFSFVVGVDGGWWAHWYDLLIPSAVSCSSEQLLHKASCQNFNSPVLVLARVCFYIRCFFISLCESSQCSLRLICFSEAPHWEC